MRKDVIEQIKSDIKYLEDLEVEIEYDSINPNDYSPTPTDNEIKEAFKQCGYVVR